MTYPIVLAHGVARFDILWKDMFAVDNSDDPVIDNLHYFKGIRTMLTREGLTVYHSNVGWSASVDKRADDLKQNILNILKATKKTKVNIIAHSMGGLDARHMMFNDRDKGRVHKNIASLTTISTPHKGSPFADWCLANYPHALPFLKKIGLDADAVKDLGTKACNKFNGNPDVIKFEKDNEGKIRFQTYAGKQKYLGVFYVLKDPFYIIEKAEGENDGLASVKSAKWKEKYFQGIIENVDHLNELGWHDPDQLLTGETPANLLRRIHKFYYGVAKTLP